MKHPPRDFGNTEWRYISWILVMSKIQTRIFTDRTRVGKNTVTFFPLKLHVWNFACDILKRYASHPCHFIEKIFLKKCCRHPKNPKNDVFCRKRFIRLLNRGILCIKDPLNSYLLKPETSQNNPKPAKTTQKNCETTWNDPKFQNWGNMEFSTSFRFSNF